MIDLGPLFKYERIPLKIIVSSQQHHSSSPFPSHPKIFGPKLYHPYISTLAITQNPVTSQNRALGLELICRRLNAGISIISSRPALLLLPLTLLLLLFLPCTVPPAVRYGVVEKAARWSARLRRPPGRMRALVAIRVVAADMALGLCRVPGRLGSEGNENVGLFLKESCSCILIHSIFQIASLVTLRCSFGDLYPPPAVIYDPSVCHIYEGCAGVIVKRHA